MDTKLLVVNGHPDPRPERDCHALCGAYRKGARSRGVQTRYLDVGTLDHPFAASANPNEPSNALAHAIAAIRWATQLATIFPLWLDAPPQALYDLFDLAERSGAMFEPLGQAPRRAAHIVVTMDLPAFMHRSKFVSCGRAPNKDCAIALPGVEALETTLIGSVERISKEQRLHWLDTMCAFGARIGQISRPQAVAACTLCHSALGLAQLSALPTLRQ